MLKLAGVTSVGALILFYLWRRHIRAKRIQSLQGKVVLITGASSGIGEACAHVFYQAGCKVVLCARRQAELERVKRQLQSLKLNITTHEPLIVALDLVDFDSLPHKVKTVIDTYGRIDVLLNNGGMSYRGIIADTLLETYKRLMDVNYFGQIAMTKAVLPYMVGVKQGHIVVVSSIQGFFTVPFRSAYSATKHAVQSFFDCLRAETGQHNIRVTVMCPGYVQTSLSMNALTGHGTNYGVMDAATKSGLTASYVADGVLNAVAMQQNEVILAPALHRIVLYCRTLVPDLVFKIMQARAKTDVLKK